MIMETWLFSSKISSWNLRIFKKSTYLLEALLPFNLPPLFQTTSLLTRIHSTPSLFLQSLFSSFSPIFAQNTQWQSFLTAEWNFQGHRDWVTHDLINWAPGVVKILLFNWFNCTLFISNLLCSNSKTLKSQFVFWVMHNNGKNSTGSFIIKLSDDLISWS